jgi:hypothetical protein
MPDILHPQVDIRELVHGVVDQAFARGLSEEEVARLCGAIAVEAYREWQAEHVRFGPAS